MPMHWGDWSLHLSALDSLRRDISNSYVQHEHISVPDRDLWCCCSVEGQTQTKAFAYTESEFGPKTLSSTLKKIVQQFTKTESATKKQQQKNQNPQASTL